MKKASKIFMAISVVCASIGLFVGVFFFLRSLLVYKVFNTEMLTGLLAGFGAFVICLIQLIIGIIALNKINNATNRNELITIGVISLLFCSFLGGLFTLLIQDSDLV